MKKMIYYPNAFHTRLNGNTTNIDRNCMDKTSNTWGNSVSK